MISEILNSPFKMLHFICAAGIGLIALENFEMLFGISVGRDFESNSASESRMSEKNFIFFCDKMHRIKEYVPYSLTVCNSKVFRLTLNVISVAHLVPLNSTEGFLRQTLQEKIQLIILSGWHGTNRRRG